MTLPDRLPAFPFPPRTAIIMLARDEGITERGALTRVATDRALRSLAAGGPLGSDAPAGWVLSGASALHGVYLRTPRTFRIPDEIALGRISDTPEPAARIADLVAAALPGGRAEQCDPERFALTFRAPAGEGTLILHFEGPRLRAEPPTAVSGRIDRPTRGFLVDDRMGYRSAASVRAIPLPIAWAEELIARLLVTLARAAAPAGGRDEQVVRADDLRCLLRFEPDECRLAVAGPVRATFVSAVSPRVKDDPIAIASFLAGMAEGIRRTAERTLHPDAVDPDLRGADAAYGPDERPAALARIDALATSLRDGR